ncbi:MAG: transcriptional regulator [Bacilli bacterium]
MEINDKILQAMKEANKPITAGEVATATGLDRKVVDKAFNALKKEEKIVSPIRCKWEPKVK